MTPLPSLRQPLAAWLDYLEPRGIIVTAYADHGCGHLRRRGVELVVIADIHYFMADQKYVIVRHADGEDLIDDSRRQPEEEFR